MSGNSGVIDYRNKYIHIEIKEPDSAKERMDFYRNFRGAFSLMQALQDNIEQIRHRGEQDDEASLSLRSKD